VRTKRFRNFLGAVGLVACGVFAPSAQAGYVGFGFDPAGDLAGTSIFDFSAGCYGLGAGLHSSGGACTITAQQTTLTELLGSYVNLIYNPLNPALGAGIQYLLDGSNQIAGIAVSIQLALTSGTLPNPTNPLLSRWVHNDNCGGTVCVPTISFSLPSTDQPLGGVVFDPCLVGVNPIPGTVIRIAAIPEPATPALLLSAVLAALLLARRKHRA
jgi:hypothetical protein